MKHPIKTVFYSVCAFCLLAAAPGPWRAPAAGQPSIRPQTALPTCLLPLLPCALPALPGVPSLPLVHVTIPNRIGGQSQLALVSLNLRPGRVRLAATCPSTSVNMKVLIIVANPTDASTALPAIQQALDYQGTPYTVFTASPRPSDPTTNRLAGLLSNGCQANFEGVILGNGEVAYSDPTAGYESALTDPEWQSLYSFEQTFSIRQVSWYTFPDANYGFNAPTSSGDTTSSPISASYTPAGQAVYPYANTANPLTIQNVWAYKATPLDASTSVLLSDSSGNALVAIRTYSNGTQNLAMTFDGNPNLTHTVVLAYGAINWVTNGLFLGQRHIFLEPQEDDLFIDDHLWAEGTACGTDPETTPVTYRITDSDLQAFINWQNGVRSQSTSQEFRLTHAFVGEGTNGEYSPDTLTPSAQSNQAAFYWVNHTYNHENLNNTSYNETSSQLSQNLAVARQMGFTNFSTLNLITPDISGLGNPNAMQAIFDAGIRYVVSDTSQPGQNNPSPNIGIYNQYQPAVLEIPRRPDNLFYNVSNPEQWIEEYNCFYASYWGRNLAYPEVLDKESDVLVHYLLNGEMDPWMFHQPNLRAYDGTHTLLGDLMDRVLAKYDALYVLPVQDPSMDVLGGQMAARMAYSAAGVTASIVPGQSITLTSQQAAVVPVTGLPASDAETYGGQPISHVAIAAGQTITLSLNNPATSTPTNVSTASPTPTFGATATSVPSGTPTSTVLPTGTPTNTPFPTSTRTNTSVPATNTPLPTATRTSTPLPPTNTPLPTSTHTNTPLPTPTGTSTPIPPTVTQTPTPPANHPPVANNDFYSTHLLNVNLVVTAPGVLANDIDADGDPLTASLVSGPTKGLLTFNSDGSFTYTPLTSLLTFSDSFTYRASDGKASSNTATVTIQVIVP